MSGAWDIDYLDFLAVCILYEDLERTLKTLMYDFVQII
jgi:hypothetical protein